MAQGWLAAESVPVVPTPKRAVVHAVLVHAVFHAVVHAMTPRIVQAATFAAWEVQRPPVRASLRKTHVHQTVSALQIFQRELEQQPRPKVAGSWARKILALHAALPREGAQQFAGRVECQVRERPVRAAAPLSVSKIPVLVVPVLPTPVLAVPVSACRVLLQQFLFRFSQGSQAQELALQLRGRVAQVECARLVLLLEVLLCAVLVRQVWVRRALFRQAVQYKPAELIEYQEQE